ncbi:helix-turn-helix transcriptional regulator [Lichenihabitans sp. Uapishka_5]|uniref:helix-turn-helix transcriptional regulator n=1 Tax=Lichenihabitans sp. Uapishka_5 TaxID=3037302 RepID=UPI0029E7D8BE|nr:helix-turn-helix transcriptional regulator [Lichenihabitans sp. Uapishka_5]MDX7952426.1 helix-turn-helix transcriptional regulator [Lichenihabitans sp. Uapishka_5]
MSASTLESDGPCAPSRHSQVGLRLKGRAALILLQIRQIDAARALARRGMFAATGRNTTSEEKIGDMDERDRHSAEHFSDLVGAIYDCVLAPTKWTEALAAIAAAFNFQNGVLAINGYDGRALVGAVFGIDAYWLSRMLDYGTAVTDLWGGPARLAQYPIEEPIVQSRAMPLYDRDRNPYFVEWARPQGIIDAVGVGFERNAAGVSNLSLGRHESAGVVSDADIDALRTLAPHLRRAVTISRVLELKTIEASTFAATIDTLGSAILIVDVDTCCLHANDAAKTMLETKDPIALKDGELVLPGMAGTFALKQAVRDAATRLATSGVRGAGIPTTCRDGSPAVLHVMPLHRPELTRPIGRRAVAAVFVSPSAAPPQMPADALSLLYALTPAETRVFEMVVGGQTQGEIASTLGLAVSTVKTHLLRLFEKTGSKRQADLIKLATSLSAPV